MWREIRNILWPSYKNRYKHIKSFGVALSYKLKLLEAADTISHKGDLWGTPESIGCLKKVCTHMVDQKRIENAIKNLKSRLARTLSLKEVADEVCVDPEDGESRAMYYRMMNKLELKPPTKKEILECQLPFLREEDIGVAPRFDKEQRTSARKENKVKGE